MKPSLILASMRRLAALRLAATSVVAGLMGLPACTLENTVNDDPEGNMPANSFRPGPAERSLSLWSDPGENLLSALSEVEQNDRGAVLPENNRVLGGLLGEAGAYFSAMTAYTPFGSAFARQSEECAGSDLPDAIEALCGAIAGGPPDPDDPDGDGQLRWVIINELPHAAFQRAVMRKLLTCASELGFTYLAVEALEEDDAALEARGHVSRSESGLFTREPQMAGLIEDGLELGYDVVSYQVADRCSDCGILEAINRHSEEQATNLVAKTFGVDPEAKVLVIAGARQAQKRIWGAGEPYTTSLGSHLWEQTGLEPYSVDQVAVNLPALPFGASTPNPPSGAYLASGPLNGQCMGTYASESPTGMGPLNAVVVHVSPRNDEQRWDWLGAPAEQRRSVTASCAACTSAQRLLVQAFPAGIDRADRVPVDQALCAAEAACQMVLPPGAYQLVVWSEDALVGSTEADLAASDSVAITL